MLRTRTLLTALLGLALLAGSAQADLTDSLQKGTPDIKSIGPLAFGPDGVLFLGDFQGAAIFAIDTGDRTPAGNDAVKVEGIDGKIASLLGIDPKQLLIRDLKVNPASGKLYLSVSRGRTPDSPSVLLRLDRKGHLEEVPLKDVKFAKAVIANPAEGRDRPQAITCIEFVNGKVYVSGLSNEQFASTLRAISFPFTATDQGTAVEIYHGNHGRFETRSPVRTFTPYDIKGELHLLAGYTCTPLVKFPVTSLKAGAKVQGITIAELGNRNTPLDMFVYQKDGKDYILMANTSRGVMKITTDNIDKIEPITKPVGGIAGLKYDTIKEWQGVEQLAKLDNARAVILVRTPTGGLNLETVPLP
ncbi:MAG TPA: hypothetical protein VNK04_15050 [Gemmataceae bacterium]|nr:hypothetical protein [Gemmataceae bacterium]